MAIRCNIRKTHPRTPMRKIKRLQYVWPSWIILSLSLFQTASSSGDPHVHIVKQVDSADEGLYTCIAGNVLGQAWIMDSLSPSTFIANFATKSTEFVLQIYANETQCITEIWPTSKIDHINY